jgi:hypothetical protein
VRRGEVVAALPWRHLKRTAGSASGWAGGWCFLPADPACGHRTPLRRTARLGQFPAAWRGVQFRVDVEAGGPTGRGDVFRSLPNTPTGLTFWGRDFRVPFCRLLPGLRRGRGRADSRVNEESDRGYGSKICTSPVTGCVFLVTIGVAGAHSPVGGNRALTCLWRARSACPQESNSLVHRVRCGVRCARAVDAAGRHRFGGRP